uniref:Rac GTPase-activating protein 1 n=1 Tax=Meloidogyne javanica TaxID=6303 RepID=A0A915LDJ6_MELJA
MNSITNNYTSLMADTFSALEVWQKLRAHQQSQSRNIDHGITDLIDLLDWIHKEWRHSVNDNARLSNLNERLNRQIGNFELELDQARANNGALVSQLTSANTKIGSLEEELLQYKERFKIARAEIQNAAFTFPMDTPNDARHGKRRSNSLGFMPGKRSKHLDDLGRVREDDEDENDPAPLQRPLMRTLNRSISDSHIMAEEKKDVAQLKNQQSSTKCTTTTTTSTMDIRSSPMAGFCPGWTKGRTLDQCTHNFVPTNNLFSAAFSYCSVCARSLGIRSLKCNDCKLQIHENCRNNSPLPCVPMIPTPQRSNPKQRPRLADLCPDSQPQIPGQIIRCVFALEKNYINNVGLYRVPGCDSEVKKLKETFNSKYAPKLEQLDPETITGFIKKFLRDLREPIIPLSSFKEFYAAMPLENLAKVLGPTVVGTASKLTHLQQQAGGTDCHSHHYMEASKQVEILYALLTLDNNYWTAFYNWQPDNPIMLQNNQGYLGSMTPHGATIKRRPPINQRYGESVNEPHRQMY